MWIRPQKLYSISPESWKKFQDGELGKIFCQNNFFSFHLVCYFVLPLRGIKNEIWFCVWFPVFQVEQKYKIWHHHFPECTTSCGLKLHTFISSRICNKRKLNCEQIALHQLINWFHFKWTRKLINICLFLQMLKWSNQGNVEKLLQSVLQNISNSSFEMLRQW